MDSLVDNLEETFAFAVNKYMWIKKKDFSFYTDQEIEPGPGGPGKKLAQIIEFVEIAGRSANSMANSQLIISI